MNWKFYDLNISLKCKNKDPYYDPAGLELTPHVGFGNVGFLDSQNSHIVGGILRILRADVGFFFTNPTKSHVKCGIFWSGGILFELFLFFCLKT